LVCQQCCQESGYGVNTSFWYDNWVGDTPLKDRFPRLYSISTQKEALVADVWNPTDGGENWRLLWCRRFFVWEETVFEELREVINRVTLLNATDKWGWKPENDAVFMVKSVYNLVSNL
jgi:hypothetical protein